MQHRVNEELKKTASVVFVSTGGYFGMTAADTAEEYVKNNIFSIELSGGKYSPDLEKRLTELSGDINFRVHNYFPPKETPFVFNLASRNSDIEKLSIDHVNNSVQLAKNLNSSVYSFHAGFLMDPKVDELGKSISRKNLTDRNEAMDLFINRVRMLASNAGKLGVKLLVENNVLSNTNLRVFETDPLLLTNPDEIEMFMEEMPDNVGLLMDVAHLKVSANSLGFDLVEAHQKLLPYICAYHLSDNDGTEDSNMPFTKDAWFWPHINKKLDYYSVEVYKQTFTELREQQKVAIEMLETNHGE